MAVLTTYDMAHMTCFTFQCIPVDFVGGTLGNGWMAILTFRINRPRLFHGIIFLSVTVNISLCMAVLALHLLVHMDIHLIGIFIDLHDSSLAFMAIQTDILVLGRLYRVGRFIARHSFVTHIA
jgi:hypothetical protein